MRRLATITLRTHLPALAGVPGGMLAIMLAASPPAHAAVPQLNTGDTAWLLTSTALVLIMTVPGLALFYAGLVRAKNTVSMLMQVFAALCMVAVLWVVVGYSLTFTGASQSLIGGLSKLFLGGVTADSLVVTHPTGAAVPEFAYVAFQLMFACITPCLIIGAFAERMRFPALLLFIALWSLLVYAPIAHMVWYSAPPDVLSEAARTVLQSPPGEVRRRAEAALIAAQADAGLFNQWGAIDFAGGMVVHITSGVAGLVGAITLGQRLAKPASLNSGTPSASPLSMSSWWANSWKTRFWPWPGLLHRA